jgi:probable phosphoglycerate mutase
MNDSKTTTIIVVRHGETEWNRCGRQQGHLDSPLTDLGVRQAKAIAAGLADREIHALYSSDLGRALQTARIIGQRLSLDVVTDSRLCERRLGALQGLTRKEFADRYPEQAAAFSSGNPDYALPGGESARQQYHRVVECVQELATRHPGQGIAIVTHGGVLKSLFHQAINLPLGGLRRFSLFNASINTFSVNDGHWRLDTWGDIYHLKGIDTLDDE